MEAINIIQIILAVGTFAVIISSFLSWFLYYRREKLDIDEIIVKIADKPQEIGRLPENNEFIPDANADVTPEFIEEAMERRRKSG